MNVRPLALRRLAVTTFVALGLLASGAHAGGNVTLDGARKTNLKFGGTLTEPALKVDTSRVRTSVDPDRADCTKASCDITALRLTVPRGSSTGRFVVEVRAVRELNVAVFLYDAKGEQVAQADIDNINGAIVCCEAPPPTGEYTRGFVQPRLAAGQYTLVIYDRGGAGTFTANVDFRAHPPDRPRKR